jgi:hypothetical protein
MSDRRYGEKDEKEEEKRQEKEEKSQGEKWRRDPLGAVVWAAILIWAGVVLLVDNLGLLAESLEAWNIILIGAGVIILLEVVVRMLVPEYRRSVMGTFVLGLVLLAVGLGGIIGWGVLWAVVLIVIGVAMLLRGFIQRP